MKKKARHLYELEKAAESGEIPNDEANRMLSDQREIEKVKSRFEETANDHREKLRWCHDERIRRIEAETRTVVREAKTRIRKSYHQYWEQLYNHQFSERGAFNHNEKSIRGSVANAIRVFDWQSTEQRGGKLSRLFNLVISEKAGREEMILHQDSDKAEMRRQQRDAEAKEIAQTRDTQKERIADARKRYLKKAEQMKQRHEAGRDRLKQRKQRITKRCPVQIPGSALQTEERAIRRTAMHRGNDARKPA
ncbi:hypothetical protein [Novipirellula caenicola]|uniref:Uncharacterized protein n=1 Tax=Novipirellula caenicola TaxID=1536901 RepID=A0ABP9VTU2_9BACT